MIASTRLSFKKIKDINSPASVSQVIWLYFSNELAIKTLENEFTQARGKKDFYTMGLSMASILRILLGFSVSK